MSNSVLPQNGAGGFPFGIVPFNQDADYIFASLEMDGSQPYWPTSGMEKHICPAAIRAGITKRIGWHTLRHSFGTLISSAVLM